MKKALLIRFGGIGDSAPIGVVGSQLKKAGYEVTVALRRDQNGQKLTDAYIGNPCFDHLLDLVEVGPWNTRCIRTQLGFCSINNLYQDFDLVLDYMNIVEGNNTSPLRIDGPRNAWTNSRNSNYVNWYDLHLAWANINPEKVSPEDKTPKFSVSEEEKANLLKLKSHYSHFITIQASASSLARTWFQAKKLPDMILAKYPEALIAFWDQDIMSWVLVSKKGATRLDSTGTSPIRSSMALIAVSDLYIGADTGFSHIAEGLGVKNIALYSTVPAWTRNRYYKNQITVDPGSTNQEFYTFNLGLGDPLNVAEGLESLSKREKIVEELYEKKATGEIAAEALNTTVEGASMELDALMKKKASFERQQSKALSSISAKQVFELVEGVLK